MKWIQELEISNEKIKMNGTAIFKQLDLKREREKSENPNNFNNESSRSIVPQSKNRIDLSKIDLPKLFRSRIIENLFLFFFLIFNTSAIC